VSLRTICNDFLDSCVRPEIYALHKPWSPYQVCGYTGFALAVLLGMALVLIHGLLLWVLALMTPTTALTFFGLAMVTKIITGKEQLIYYHYEIAVMTAVALLVWLLGQPVLPYLDVTILGIGTFLVCGRIGCLMVGCCHGRPHRFGVCYREEHARVGFTPYYVGVRLFPIQAVESLWVLSTVLVGVIFVAKRYPPGTAVAWYIISYDIGRFFFEFMRGDPLRPYLWGFSVGQWTSAVLMAVVVWLELLGPVPYEPWHGAATAALVLVMAVVALTRHFHEPAKYRLLNPRHVREIAQAVELVSHLAGARPVGNNGNVMPDNIPVQYTSLGICISASLLPEGSARLQHYALSCQDNHMTEEIAQIIAGVILTIKHTFNSKELLRGRHGVYHVLLHRATR
jgi:hypothetical protein